jgi:hypothetical protein
MTIDTDMKIECLGVSGSTIVVADQKNIVTWNLVTGNTRVNLTDSVQIRPFDRSPPSCVKSKFTFMLLSPNLSHIATLGWIKIPWDMGLEIYKVSTGRCLAGIKTGVALQPHFTQDGFGVWGIGSEHSYSAVKGWEIIEDSESGITELQPLGANVCPPAVFPWQSSLGYQVTDDGWILSPTQRQLLWLPHHWRTDENYWRWGGRFLGLLHGDLPEVIILEFMD